MEPNLDLQRALLAAIFIVPLILIPNGQMYLYAHDNKQPGEAVELAYIQAHWQAGDIIYAVGEDAWINTAPDGWVQLYKAPDCGVTLGGLSPRTQAAIGEVVRPLDQISHTRAWVMWEDSPVIPACQKQQVIAMGLDPKKPLLRGGQSEFVMDGLWLQEAK